MHFLSKFSLLTLVPLISLSLGGPLAPRMPEPGFTLIGYRTVNEMEAKSINGQKTLVYSKHFDQNQQLGNGKSLCGKAGEWCVGTGNWSMQTTELRDLEKIWIPESYWFKSEASVAQYIKSKGKDVKKTLRFAQVDGKNFNELFVPSELLIADEHFIHAHCFKDLQALHEGMKKDDIVEPSAGVDYTTSTFAGPRA